MSKMIKITPEIVEILKDKFISSILESKFEDGKVFFSEVLSADGKKAILKFKEAAWLKMDTLIREFGTEVGWHGLAARTGENEYTISDIMVYPQEVSGATVTTDQNKYQTWLMSQPDEIFNNIRMQGHSHVNMSVSPSSVDLSLYKRILDQLDDDMFYIFLIWNKKGEKTIKIYDMAKNALFENSDVDVVIESDLIGLDGFLKDAKDNVVSKAYTSYTPTYNSKYGGSYGQTSMYGEYGYGTSYGQKNSADATKYSKSDDKKSQKNESSKSTKKGEKQKTKVKYDDSWDCASDRGDFEARFGRKMASDDDDDPFGPFGSLSDTELLKWMEENR